LTAGFGGMIALVDGTIHHQDIRRALGHRRTVPVDRLERILPLVPRNPRLGAGRRIRGLRLGATDVVIQTTWPLGVSRRCMRSRGRWSVAIPALPVRC
jgi:hypothetical protein